MTIPVRTLRELFRNLQAWQSLYETEGVDSVTGPDNCVYCLHDISYLYAQSQACQTNASGKTESVLSRRQAQSIRLFLFENIKETEVARIMGVSETNPVASYATQGLVRLNELIAAGRISRFRHQAEAPRDLQEAS